MNEINRKRAIIFGGAIVAGALLGMLLLNIFEKVQQGRRPFHSIVELTDDTSDPAIWGKNFPQHYLDYNKTVDQVRTRFGGSEAVPRTPSAADPRSITAQSKLEEDPRLKTMWAGYGFSLDFREERGHAFMLSDQRTTKRVTQIKQPGTCLNCHASTYNVYKSLGNGDIMAGFTKLNQMPYDEATKLASHPVGCIDCHTATTMQLRVTRPAFIEGMRDYMAKVHGRKNYDVNKDATRQEMRSFVCGQCHVEYYFKGKEKRLTYPWSKGLRADQILAYYEQSGFSDWTHKQTGAPVLKAQHPEFEMWNQGVHGRSGVACADCHMPYKRIGAAKISDHHVRSPLLNVDNSCRTCHPVAAEELLARAHRIQQTTAELRSIALDGLMQLIGDVQSNRARMSPDRLAKVQNVQRRAQFLIDFVEAENSMGFHAPQEAARVLGLAIEELRKGQRLMAGQ